MSFKGSSLLNVRLWNFECCLTINSMTTIECHWMVSHMYVFVISGRRTIKARRGTAQNAGAKTENGGRGEAKGEGGTGDYPQ